MRLGTPAFPGAVIPGLLIALCVVAPGCNGDRFRAARRSSTETYRRHLLTVPAGAESPEQAARTAALRARVLEAEWLERGYRVGNEKGGDKFLYTASGKGLAGGLWYPFRLLGQALRFSFENDRPSRAARWMEDTKSADTRRRGINDLARWDFAQEGPYVKRYRQIAQDDPDPLVRATALRALNRARDPDARPLFIAALRDPNVEVRLEAAKGLAHLPDANAAVPLTRVVSNAEEDKDVRIAAAEALKYYKSVEVARALISRLNERDFGVAWQSRRSLRKLAGKDLGYDEAAWLAYIAGPDSPLG